MFTQVSSRLAGAQAPCPDRPPARAGRVTLLRGRAGQGVSAAVLTVRIRAQLAQGGGIGRPGCGVSHLPVLHGAWGRGKR